MERMIRERKKEVKKQAEKPRFVYKWEHENIEIKRLDSEDVEESTKVMRKCSFDVTESELQEIIRFGMSFGATVNRMIVGVGLAWPARFDEKAVDVVGGQANALFLEDPAVLLSFEGRGIRRMLIREREEEAKRRGYSFVVSYLEEDIPSEDIGEYIKEAGTKLEMIYWDEGYKFARTPKGILVFKKVK